MSNSNKCYGKNKPGGKKGSIGVAAGKGTAILNRLGKALLRR